MCSSDLGVTDSSGFDSPAIFLYFCFTSKVLRRLISPVYALGLRINIYILIRLKGKHAKRCEIIGIALPHPSADLGGNPQIGGLRLTRMQRAPKINIYIYINIYRCRRQFYNFQLINCKS